MNEYTKKLLKLQEEAERDSIRAVVIADALDEEDPHGYLKNVDEYGCQSGEVRGLFYTRDCEEFYQKHSKECDEVLYEYEQNMGEPFRFKGRNVQNILAWMAYQEHASRVLREIDDEY